jgi:hypothetical protein
VSPRCSPGCSGSRLTGISGFVVGTSVAVVAAAVGIPVGPIKTALATAVGVLAVYAIAAVPVALGVGLLRYRLYDIDRLISRTIAYTALTGLLTGRPS